MAKPPGVARRWGEACLGSLLGALSLKVRRQRQLGQLEGVELALEDARAVLQQQPHQPVVLDARGAAALAAGRPDVGGRQQARPQVGELLGAVAVGVGLGQPREEVEDPVQDGDVRLAHLGHEVAQRGDPLHVDLHVERSVQLLVDERLGQLADVSRQRGRRKPRVTARDLVDVGMLARRVEVVDKIVDLPDARVTAKELLGRRAGDLEVRDELLHDLRH